MEGFTAIWYFTTFMVLVFFFILIACYDSHCLRRRRGASTAEDVKENDRVVPSSPAPSYSQFAPPAYDSVLPKDVFFVQVTNETRVAPAVATTTISTQTHSQSINEYI